MVHGLNLCKSFANQWKKDDESKRENSKDKNNKNIIGNGLKELW